VDEDRSLCIGLDTHEAKIAVAVAEPGRLGEVRFQGEIANRPDAVRRLIERLGTKHGRLKVCYEAGPCGYGLYRQITGLGHDCTVVAPSLVPVRAGWFRCGRGTGSRPTGATRSRWPACIAPVS
jgi:transposase